METQGSSSTTGVGSSSAPTIVEMLPCKRNPKIWGHYNLCKMSDSNNSKKLNVSYAFNFIFDGNPTQRLRLIYTSTRNGGHSRPTPETKSTIEGRGWDCFHLRWESSEKHLLKDNVKMLLEGSELMKDEHESQLYDDFEHFRQNKGEIVCMDISQKDINQAKQIKPSTRLERIQEIEAESVFILNGPT
ncbi:hypothetical protein Tco_1087608, partial [Tanacetum coccineum]